jgi:uncharacterized protein (TIGR03437 family)
MTGPAPRYPNIVFLCLLCLLFLVGAPRTWGSTLLTNGHPIHVRVDSDPVEFQTLIAGLKGYTVFVPPGARQLVIEFATTPSAAMELIAQTGRDVGTEGLGTFLADFRDSPSPVGIAQLVIDETTFPRLTSGIYFIGFFIFDPGLRFEGHLTATVDGGAIEPQKVLVESTFDSTLEGWTRSDTPSPLPGTSVGDADSSIRFVASGGNPGGYARLDDNRLGEKEFFVAPPAYSRDYLALGEPRFVFDIARIGGSDFHDFFVQVRVFSTDGAFRWPAPTPPPDVGGGWMTFSASIRKDQWFRFAGTATYEEVFSDVQRVEVSATYNSTGGSTGLDNFRLMVRGFDPPRTVLPTITAFSAGPDSWSRNYPASDVIPESTVGDAGSRLIWNAFEGNHGGFLRMLEDGGPGEDAFLASELYLGDITGLMDENPRLEFDYMHTSDSGATRPVEVRLYGLDDTVFLWTGVAPSAFWVLQRAPLSESEWTRVSGERSFAETLANVIRLSISADQSDGPEWNAIDNVALLTDDSPIIPQSLSANPATLNFSAFVTGPNPDPRTLTITASGGELYWEAEVSGDLAGRISLSETEGRTPSEVTVVLDTQNLPKDEVALVVAQQLDPGFHQAVITVTPVGATVSPVASNVSLNLGEQPSPTPEIFPGGVINSASYIGRLAPGALGTVFGKDLGGPESGILAEFTGRSNDRLPTNIAGIRVLVHDAFGSLLGEAPLLYLDDQQINFQMPFEVAGMSRVRIVVDNNGARSEPEGVQLTPSAPGIFTYDGVRAIATNQDGSLNSPTNPAARRDVMTVYMTGQGPVAPNWPTGKAASAVPLILAPTEAHAVVGGVEGKIEFLGLAPGMVGVLQMNFRPNHFTPLGDQSLKARIGRHESNPGVISIR